VNKVISALFLSLSPITRKVLVATITLICLAVPAITTVSLIYWLRPWRLVETLWLLGIGLMIATLLSIRLSQRRLLLITSWGHDHRLGHGNLQESQLAKVDSDAKEGVGRNDDQGRIVTIYYIVTDNPSQVPQ